MRDDDNSENGPILSNNESIHALRQGVSVEMRTCHIEAELNEGGAVQVPVRLVEKGPGQISVEVAKDVLDEADRRSHGPRRRAGTVDIGSLDSLVEYINRYKPATDDETVAFAPLDPPGITAIFDYHAHGAGAPGWCGDRAVYKCPLSRQWKLWTSHDGKSAFTQVQFGDLIEANELDLYGDDALDLAPAAKMLEVARNLVIHQSNKYERKVNPTTGEGTLVAVDEHDAKTSTKIPKKFGLAIPVFEGSDVKYPVECRIRFTMEGGRPQFAFVMQNRQDVFDTALTELRKAVAEKCGIPVFVGNPPAAAK
jgi:uncharacterized protein YfdQ (DUF2303 family)